MSQPLRLASLAAVVALLSSAPAAATLVMLDDCDASGCQGSSVSLEVNQTSPGVYSVKLTLDSTGFDESRDGVNQAGFKAIQDFSDVSLVSAPSAGWSDPISAPINSNGDVCAASPSPSDQICTAGFVDIIADGPYTWEFEVLGGTLLPTSDWHIGFQYANAPGPARGKIVSAQGVPAVPVPEPSAALAFAVGLGVVGLRLGRRRGA